MRVGRLCGALLPLLACAQEPTPAIRPLINVDGIIRSDTNFPGKLSPGTRFSVYGRHLGPATGCHAETPEAHVQELCGVRVVLGGTAAELSYVQEKQINARIPDDAPKTGAASLQVILDGIASTPAEIRLGPLPAKIGLEGEARVDGPVWIHIDSPPGGVSYPVRLEPWEFSCIDFEVRSNGKALPTIAPHPAIGMVSSGNPCGFLSLPAGGARRSGRLPLHLRYRFDTPGTYEVRYSGRGFSPVDIRSQSDWTPIEILPASPRRIETHPQDPAELLSDFLPNLLSLRNDEALAVLFEYLYHPSDLVRRYAELALYYWPDTEVETRLLAYVRANGPTDVAVQRLRKSPLTELIDASLPYLTSDDSVLRRGAESVCHAALGASLTPELRSRVEQAMLRSADRVLSLSDSQEINNFVSTLGQVHDEAGHQLLWTLVNRNVGREQAVIAIAWRKDVRDLPRLSAFLQPSEGHEYSSLPNVLRSQFGATALPYLRDVMEKSASPAIRAACAEELIYAKDAAGFAFFRRAIQQSSPYKARLISFINGQFPATRNVDEATLLEFLSHPPVQ